MATFTANRAVNGVLGVTRPAREDAPVQNEATAGPARRGAQHVAAERDAAVGASAELGPGSPGEATKPQSDQGSSR